MKIQYIDYKGITAYLVAVIPDVAVQNMQNICGTFTLNEKHNRFRKYFNYRESIEITNADRHLYMYTMLHSYFKRCKIASKMNYSLIIGFEVSKKGFFHAHFVGRILRDPYPENKYYVAEFMQTLEAYFNKNLGRCECQPVRSNWDSYFKKDQEEPVAEAIYINNIVAIDGIGGDCSGDIGIRKNLDSRTTEHDSTNLIKRKHPLLYSPWD